MAVLLNDGSVLVAGGYRNGQLIDTAERYLPDGQAWVAAGRMNVPRVFGTATLLKDGSVLVAGGGSTGAPGYKATAAAEIYDPNAGTWTPTGSLVVARTLHTATLLQNGKVLIAGGAANYHGTTGAVAWSTELYDPAKRTFIKTGQMATPRYCHSAVLLGNGRVLVVGGWARTSNDDPSRATAEIYNPSTGKWSATGSMSSGRARFGLTMLHNGRVLVAGGISPAYTIVGGSEVYDPATGKWHSADDLPTAVMGTGLITLKNGQVLIAGGATATLAHKLTNAAALYTP